MKKEDLAILLGLSGAVKKMSFKKVSLHTLLGGVFAYSTLKASGASDTVSIIAGVVSAATSGFSAASDTNEYYKDENNK